MAFIGRERELAVLGSALQQAAGGEPTRVAIAGPLGIGITRLIDELEERLTGLPEVLLCRGRCYEPRSGIAYAAVRDAIGNAIDGLADDRFVAVVGPAAHDVVLLLPRLRERIEKLGVSAEQPPLDAPHQRGARVRESLLGVIERLGNGRQVCLVIEDLEHSDPGTRELVSLLLRFSRRLPLALVVGYHPEEMPRGHPARGLVREIEESHVVERVVLPALTRDEMLTLVEAEQGERPTLGFMAAVIEGSRGNPLVALQLVAAHQQLAGLRLSDPLDEILHARVAQLDPAPVRLLRLLAAAGRPVDERQLASIRLADGHLPRNAVGPAIESGLARPENGGVTVVHALCAEAIDQLALPAERHAIHAALAEQLATEPAEAAWHWIRAARPKEARAAHVAAAEAAAEVEPGRTALFHYASALELANDGPGGESEIVLLTAAASAADACGSFRRAATFTEQAIARVAGGRVERLRGGPAGARKAERIRAGELSEQLGRYRRSGGDALGARQAFQQAVELIPEEASVARARALAALAQDLMLEGRFADSATVAEEARRAAQAAGDDGLAEFAHASGTLGVDLGYVGEIDRGLRLIEKAMETSRRIGRLDELMRGYANRTTLLDLDTRREEALAIVKEGIAEATRSGLGSTYGAFLRGNAADILFELGRWTESEAECRAAMEFPPAGVAWFSPILYLGLVLVESRADEEAARLVGRTLLQLETVPAGQWSALVLRTAVSLALWRAEYDDARNAARQGWERVLETDDPGQIVFSAATVLEACAASAERGRIRRDWSAVAEAGALADSVLPAAEQYLARHELPPSVGARREAELYLATAEAHSARVRGRQRPETWAELAEAWAKVPVPYQAAKAHWWEAQAALPTRSKRNEARRALTKSWEIATELPARPLRRALRDLAERARITLPETELVAIPIETGDRELVAVGPGRPQAAGVGLANRVVGRQPTPAEGRFGLSPRENAVLLVLTEGRTNREIAERLFISERTVAVHVRRILAKLGVGGRVEAAGLAIRLGLVPDDPRAAIRSARMP